MKKSDENKNPLTPLMQDDQIAGFWKLDQTNKDNVQGMSFPRVMKFQIHRNGVRQVDNCDLNETGQSMSGYEINRNNLVINYYGYQDVSGPKPNEMPATLKTFSAKITKLDSENLEFNGYTMIFFR